MIRKICGISGDKSKALVYVKLAPTLISRRGEIIIS